MNLLCFHYFLPFYRSYWIHWDIDTQTVSVGVCKDPEEDMMLQYFPLVSYNISHIYLSTGDGNNGSWEFASGAIILCLLIRQFIFLIIYDYSDLSR